MLLLPGAGSLFLTKNIKGGLGDFTFMLIRIPLAHPPSKKMNAPLVNGMCQLHQTESCG